MHYVSIKVTNKRLLCIIMCFSFQIYDMNFLISIIDQISQYSACNES